MVIISYKWVSSEYWKVENVFLKHILCFCWNKGQTNLNFLVELQKCNILHSETYQWASMEQSRE